MDQIKQNYAQSSLAWWTTILALQIDRTAGWALPSRAALIGAAGWTTEIPRSSVRFLRQAGLEDVFSFGQGCK